jgi:hypothetical protein
MGAIDSEDLEVFSIQIPDPTRKIPGLAIPGIDVGISIGGEPGLTLGKLLQLAEREPRFVARLPLAGYGREQVTDNRHGEYRTDDSIEQEAGLRE